MILVFVKQVFSIALVHQLCAVHAILFAKHAKAMLIHALLVSATNQFLIILVCAIKDML